MQQGVNMVNIAQSKNIFRSTGQSTQKAAAYYQN